MRVPRFFRLPRTIPFTLLGALLLASCEKATDAPDPSRTLPRRITWNAQAAESIETDSLIAPGSPEGGAGILKVHTLDFRNSGNLILVLREYRKDYLAYAAFQAQADAEELRQGVFREKTSLFFIHGPFLGEIRPEGNALMPLAFVHEKLAFHPEEGFLRPKAFQAFPLVGRIPGSERVLGPSFLGRKGKEIFFVMAYQCGPDTALLFRGLPGTKDKVEEWTESWKGNSDTSKWSGEVHFSGALSPREPLDFWFLKGGVRGVLGCFDSKLSTEYGEKLKKMEVLLPNP